MAVVVVVDVDIVIDNLHWVGTWQFAVHVLGLGTQRPNQLGRQVEQDFPALRRHTLHTDVMTGSVAFTTQHHSLTSRHT